MNILVLVAFGFFALSGSAAGRDYSDEEVAALREKLAQLRMKKAEQDDRKMRALQKAEEEERARKEKARAKKERDKALELARLEVEKEERAIRLQAEKTRTAQAEARRAEAEARAAAARGYGRRELPKKVSLWTPEDADEAFRRANAGDGYCGAALGMMHEYGLVDRPINLKKAVQCYKSAIEDGNEGAKNLLARVQRKIRDPK